ncbi:hypothetical protein LshimejAT787_0407830 [Lyophyllum shimeji]|uniref:Extracellular serine-rich protein n=1 Tax=Lyophyllum shimeji TaxID=47721 RepID=A0A9P3PK61_LYOSH|nr:hypothetical protein LshimejAT787_0407830 [Lyophyllum shimeji]
MHRVILTVFLLMNFAATYAKTIVITVGGNTTSDATSVFQPNSVVAREGDVVLFNFTQGNHTATQSTFAAPCVRAHDSDITFNGFDSSFRNAGDGEAITTLPVTISDSNTTIWFFDFNTCAKGGVGAINVNTSSTETLDGFQRNAQRLNGTSSSTSSSASSASRTRSATGTNPTSTSSSSDANHIALGTPGLFALLGCLISALSL